jgi:hypothetical protein
VDEAEREGLSNLVIHRLAPVVRRARPIEAQFQGLWFTLSRVPWRSLVFVPADDDSSAAGIATALADVGRRLLRTPVTFLVMAGPIDYASAGKFMATVAGKAQAEVGPNSLPSSRVIVAVPPVIVEPLALAVIESADAVALCVRKGSTYLESASRTVDLVGRGRVIGCVIT